MFYTPLPVEFVTDTSRLSHRGRANLDYIEDVVTGSSRYSGYRCTWKFLWFTLEKEEFYSGRSCTALS